MGCFMPYSYVGSCYKACRLGENQRFETGGTRSVYIVTNDIKEGNAACAYAYMRAYRKKRSKLFACSGPFIWEEFMLEKHIEKKLSAAVKKMGGIAAKFVSPGFDGMPDRLVLLPGGRIAFVELKAPAKKPRSLQARRIKQLRKLGFACYVVDDAGRIGGILDEIQTS